MSFLSRLTAYLPFSKKQEAPEIFFALNIENENITAALWNLEGNRLKILDTVTDSYSGLDNITGVTDRLLDAIVGEKEINPQKILFGVPDSWLSDENLKEDYLKLLRKLVKELELTPMAYVSSANALVHFLEKQEGVPTTAILVGLEVSHVIVTVARAGKVDGTKVAQRSDDPGLDIEKVLLTFTGVEVLPSKILIYGMTTDTLEKTKAQLMSFSWMSKLSFLHFPKIETLVSDAPIIGVCFAGASEMDENALYSEMEIKKKSKLGSDLLKGTEKDSPVAPGSEDEKNQSGEPDQEGFGFVVGDVAEQAKREEKIEEGDFGVTVTSAEAEDYGVISAPPPENLQSPVTSPGFLKKMVSKRFGKLPLLGFSGILLLAAIFYIFLLRADIKVFVEPRILENNTQVIADPNIKSVIEDERKIPGQIVETDVTGSGKGVATGKKQIGDPAKGTVMIRNKTDGSVTLARGTTFTSSGGMKFNLDLSVTVASKAADEGTYGKATVTVTAAHIGPDSNLPSGSDLSISGYSGSQLTARAEGNFSGGTSKDVAVVSSEDQQKLLAQVAADLRKGAQQKLQEKLTDKKVLEETLYESIVKKSFSKNINDQATDFTLNLSAHYKGTAYNDKDLRIIVSKLVSTTVPEGFSLDLSDTEAQADVSKVEKDGRVIFLAKFKAKLIPNINTDEIRRQIKGKSEAGAVESVKKLDNILGAEIKLIPNLPGFLRRLPILEKNIRVEVGFK